MLEVEGLDVYYGDAQALDGVSVVVPERQILAIVGANGAGKTTLIRSIGGMLRPRHGKITYQGKDITGLPSHKVCNLGIGHVAEGRQIFPTLSISENLDMGAMLPRARSKRAATRKSVLDMFPRLAERLSQAAGTLSGGEQQMLAIGRCLMGRPDVILFDEPSLGLSPAMVQQVIATIRTLSEQGMTCVLVEQNVSVSLKISSTGYVLENGRVTLSGRGSDLLTDDRVRKAYLGL